MNMVSKTAAALLLGATVTLFAADTVVDAGANVSVNSEGGIDAQIEKIKNADPSKRRELMNRFKEELAAMNREERMEAITKLRKEMHIMNGEQMKEHSSEHAQHGTERMGDNMENMHDMAQHQQSMQMEHAGEMEQMHQMQGMDQHSQMQNSAAQSGSMQSENGMEMPFGGGHR